MKKSLITLLFLVIFAIPGLAQLSPADSVIEGNINSDAFLSKSKRYLLRGFVNVNAPATLHIEAGTVIYGEKDSKATLIINRGAKINANGTANAPIVFTSQQPAGQRQAGDWGGIIIAGNARINVPAGTAVIEGGTGTIYGGGATPNDDDNSGVIRYLRLEFSGIALSPDNEINGLTMGGVGRGTTIEYVQVSFNGDDSFEWFGGNVNGKYLISFGTVDDDFDTDLGFSGKVQFGAIIRNKNIADISSSNGFESDNDGGGSFNAPRTQPWFSNVTVVGPMPDTSATDFNPLFRRGQHLRRSTQTSTYNSIVMGWPTALFIDGSGSGNSASGDTLQIRNTIYAGIKFNGITTNASGFNINTWLNTPAYGNRTYVQPSQVMLTDPFNFDNPNLVPMAGSPAASGASFAGRLLDNFFVQTTYVGAFDPNGPRWDAGWANYNPQNTDYTTSVRELDSNTPSDFALLQNYPNPFNPSTTIRFSIPEAGNVRLAVFNTLGEEIETLVNEFVNAGTFEVAFDASNLPSGVYVYKLTSGSLNITKKMSLLK